MNNQIKLLATLFIVAIFSVNLFAPSLASAQTDEQIIQQLQQPEAQLGRLQIQLQAQIGVLQQQSSTVSPTEPEATLISTPIASVSSECPTLSNTLYRGVSDANTGGEVTKLQKILATDPNVYPEGLVTGYYGPLTESAVQRWQAKQEIVSSGSPATTGYGVVGPRTRAGMINACPTLPETPVTQTPTITTPQPILGPIDTQATISSECPTLSNTLYRGVSDANTGGEVTKLQKILATDPNVYPEGLVTGYYGPLTESAVQRWQAKQEIVSSGSPATTGYGVVGPRTRAGMINACPIKVKVDSGFKGLKIFVPQSFVPLSAFTKADAGSFSLLVRSDILTYLTARSAEILIAYETPQGVKYLTPSRIDYAGGKVYAIAPDIGYYTVVSDAFTNDFPIVTHWDQSLNGGRGGPKVGATDTLLPLWLDMSDDAIKGIFLSGKIHDTNPSNPYSWNTADYALFSDDPVAKVPSFERYIAENYALMGVPDIVAIWLSDKVLQETGFPVMYRNYPHAFSESAETNKRISKQVPIFQVVNSFLIASEPKKESLATFLLPPYWTNAPSDDPYPVLFNGWYDINQNTFNFHGLPFLKIIGDAYNSGLGEVVGLLWNGGGGYGGTRTFNRSAYDNAALLFDTTKTILGIDPHKVISFGFSRGGLTAIEMAANPYHNNYTMEYAISFGGPCKMGDWSSYINTSYIDSYRILEADTGYKYSWQQGWRESETGRTARELLLNNWFGITDADTIDQQLSCFSDQQVNSLRQKGTKVYYALGTNDPNFPFSIGLEFVDKLRQNGVSVSSNIFYRGGHAIGSTNIDPYNLTRNLLQEMINPEGVEDHVYREGTFYYKPKNETERYTYVPFSPPYQPIVLEAPKLTFYGDTASFVFAGEPGMSYSLKAWKINDDLWDKQKRIEKIYEEPYFQIMGSFPTSRYAVKHLPIPTSISTGYYIYDLYFAVPGEELVQVPPEAVPHVIGDKQPVFSVTDQEPLLDVDSLLRLLVNSDRGWGLSGDILFTR